jgi:hypothetical protein
MEFGTSKLVPYFTGGPARGYAPQTRASVKGVKLPLSFTLHIPFLVDPPRGLTEADRQDKVDFEIL